MIRVLVVDDSAFMRKMIPRILESDEEIQVVGTAMDGVFAMKKIGEIKPDVITLDIDMPRMDGIETLRQIVQDFGIPTIMVSSLSKKDADLTLSALEIGAFDFVTKPRDAISVHINTIGNELIEKIKAAHRSPVARLRKVRRQSPVREQKKKPSTAVPSELVKKSVRTDCSAEQVIAIGISTGGPNALTDMLPLFPDDFPACLLIVQHMPEGFTGMFAARLNALSKIEVKEASDGDIVAPGRVLIAPGDKHLRIKRLPLGVIAVLSSSPQVNGHRPSADVLFHSVASEYGARGIGVIMTGMGSDGAEGLGEIKKQGGLTIAQDESSSVVFGMPKAAIEKGFAGHILPLDVIAEFLINSLSKKEITENGRLK